MAGLFESKFLGFQGVVLLARLAGVDTRRSPTALLVADPVFKCASYR